MTRPSLTPEQERLLAERDYASDESGALADYLRLKACGDDHGLYQQKEMERLDVLFAPLRSEAIAAGEAWVETGRVANG